MIIKHDPPPSPINYALLPVGRKYFALVDRDVYELSKCYHWRRLKSSHCSYVCRRLTCNGHTITLRLHIYVMNPPPGYEVHHIDHNPLNCLRSNLVNVTPCDHRQLHGKAF